MENILFLSVISFFAVFGVYLLIREIFRTRFCPYPEKVTLSVRNCEDDIEYTLRALLIQYPASIIVVEDNYSTDATAEIARRMAARNKRIDVRQKVSV